MRGEDFLLPDSDILFDQYLIAALLNSPSPDALAQNRQYIL
jgi:hypothetical protein